MQGLIDDEEQKGIPRSRIVVGGFSQGGAVAVYSALAYDKQPLAAILALSTWLPLNKDFPQVLLYMCTCDCINVLRGGV